MTAELAQLALDNRLYFSDNWCLKRDLSEATRHPQNFYIDVHYVDGEPVGIALVRTHSLAIDGENLISLPESRLFAQVFVVSKHRRSGIGRKLVERLPFRGTILGGRGLKGSSEFWKKVLIPPDTLQAKNPPESWIY